MALTKEQWDHLGEKPRWDILVALRGPDSYYGETLKWFTTAVIRGRVRNAIRIGTGGAALNKDLKLVVLPDDRGVSRGSPNRADWNASHFIQHVHDAACWLKLPAMLIPADLWHELMSGGFTIATAASEILRHKPTSITSSTPTTDTLYREFQRHYNDFILPRGI